MYFLVTAQSRQSSRPTNQPVLASGILRPGDPFNQSLSMRYPLNNISYSRLVCWWVGWLVGWLVGWTVKFVESF